MLDYDERPSNIIPLVYIVFIDMFFLFLESVAKKIKNSQELMRGRLSGCFLRKKRGPIKFRRRLKNLKKYTGSRAPGTTVPQSNPIPVVAHERVISFHFSQI